MDINIIRSKLGEKIDDGLVIEIIKEFFELKKVFLTKDRTKVGIVSGRFCELIAAALYNYYNHQPVDINNIKFDYFVNNIQNITKRTAEDELLSLNIPLYLKSIYSLRSKRRIAHIKKFDPNIFDINLMHDSCTWIFCQLILLWVDNNEKELYEYLDSLIEKEIPIIQEFEDGSIIVLKKDIDFKDELLLILYKSSKRLTNKELKQIIKTQYSSKITTYLRLLNKDKLVHNNSNGSLITKLGIYYVEKEVINTHKTEEILVETK